jgi:hypothetical protein
MERHVGGDNDGGVIVAHWQATEADGDYSARSYGTCSFTPDSSSPDYVPYEDLTEATVLAWCFAGDVDKDAVEASLTAQIEEQKNPTTEDGVPW